MMLPAGSVVTSARVFGDTSTMSPARIHWELPAAATFWTVRLPGCELTPTTLATATELSGPMANASGRVTGLEGEALVQSGTPASEYLARDCEPCKSTSTTTLF